MLKKALLILLFTLTYASTIQADDELMKQLSANIQKGMDKRSLFNEFPKSSIRSQRKTVEFDTITFDFLNSSLATFYIKDERVEKWAINDIDEYIQQYISEFVSGNLSFPDSLSHRAITAALTRLPIETLLLVTQRSRPIIFTDYYTTGIAKFASSTEFLVDKNDPSTFSEGFFLIKLGDSLYKTNEVVALEAVILHEIAHRVLDNLRSHEHPCEIELQTNKLVQSWGAQEGFKSAKHHFGSKKKSDSPCHDYIKSKKNSKEKL